MKNHTSILDRIRIWFGDARAIIREAGDGFEVVIGETVYGKGSTPAEAFADAVGRHA